MKEKLPLLTNEKVEEDHEIKDNTPIAQKSNNCKILMNYVKLFSIKFKKFINLLEKITQNLEILKV